MVTGYSGTPLATKLGIKAGSTVWLVGAPTGFEAELEPMPEQVSIRRRVPPGAGRVVDVAVLFTTWRRHLDERYPKVMARVAPAGGLWVAWPKRASAVATDLTENVVREMALAAGMVDNKVCAVTDVWSGLRLVWRLGDRPGLGRT
jgi:hypothetical protein